VTDERELLAAARRGLSPTAADQARVRRATDAALAPGGAATTVRAAPWATRVVVVGAIAAGAAGLGYRVGVRAGREQAASERAVATASPARAEPTPPPVPTANGAWSPEERGRIVAPTAATPRPSVAHRRNVADAAVAPAAPGVPAASLAEEVRALRAVERALREGNPGFALALLRELDRAVPNGQLVEERLATRTIARCATGDVPIGVDLADDFAARHPDSVYGRRVADACAETDSPVSGDSVVRRPKQ
jgi:hypothetical protein